MWHEYKAKDCYCVTLLMLQEFPGRFYVLITGSKVTFIHEVDTDTLMVKYSEPFPLPPQTKENKFLHYQGNSLPVFRHFMQIS